MYRVTKLHLDASYVLINVCWIKETESTQGEKLSGSLSAPE